MKTVHAAGRVPGAERCPACRVDLRVSPPVLLGVTLGDAADGESALLCDSCLCELPAEPEYLRLALRLAGYRP